MRTLLTGCLAILMAFTVGMDLYTRFLAPQPAVYTVDPVTYQIIADNDNINEVFISEEGNDLEPTEANVIVSLTIDENGNIAG